MELPFTLTHPKPIEPEDPVISQPEANPPPGIKIDHCSNIQYLLYFYTYNILLNNDNLTNYTLICNIVIAAVPATEPETKNTDAPIDNNLIMFDTRFEINSYSNKYDYKLLI